MPMVEFCRRELQKKLPEFARIASRGGESFQYFAEQELHSLLIGYTSRPNVDWNEYLVSQGYVILRQLQSCPARFG